MFRDDKASERVKLAILELLFEKYGIIEADFLSAELTMVPAFCAADVGFDRNFIGAYGHDDRVCAYTSLMAEVEAQKPEYTTVSIFADKEEVGSDGKPAQSRILEYFMKTCHAAGTTAARCCALLSAFRGRQRGF
jgi:aspartyl aminopeptidase